VLRGRDNKGDMGGGIEYRALSSWDEGENEGRVHGQHKDKDQDQDQEDGEDLNLGLPGRAHRNSALHRYAALFRSRVRQINHRQFFLCALYTFYSRQLSSCQSLY
jgi:hypothetical protein